ncbi:MAG TPA: hypothetical protein VK067_04875 [Pseudogracilibacillus sp.]|nr:hypothetical protein [Pseudogracilibacillus sp.]
MKKFLLLLVIALFLATVLSFVLGYSNYGVGLGTILIFVAMGAARYYSISNQEYIYRNQHDRLYK